ncbi:MAG TPA: glycosyltransferase [Candidatus Acidoferrum sp.]|nr:glycosyltransferase [Candidatus Acidoferrum sp.]
MMTATEAPVVTLVVVQRESLLHTKTSLESIYAHTTVPFELVYVDAGSPPWIAAYLRREARTRGFRLLRFEQQLFPSAARNRGFAVAATEYVVFIDNDVVVTPGWLEALLACAREESATIVGGIIALGPPGTTVHAVGGVIRVTETQSGRMLTMKFPLYDAPWGPFVDAFVRERVDMVEFHCMLVHAERIRPLFPLDEALETVLEFEDLCMRAGQAGMSVFFEPRCRVGQLLPLPLPRGLPDVPMFWRRWSRRRNVASIEHFRRKWNISPDDPALRGMQGWSSQRRYLPLRGTPLYRAIPLLRRIRQKLALISGSMRIAH